MKLIDLTLEISIDLPSFPGSPKPQFIPWADIEHEKYNLELLFMSSHSGTHMDAPFHFVNKGKKINQISPSRLISDALLLKVKKSSDQAITKNDIKEFEKQNGEISKNSTVVFYTGWQSNLRKKYYFAKNPGLSESAAKYLVEKQVKLVGIDSPSIDLGKNEKFSVHNIFSKSDVIIVENLCNLEKIRRKNFTLIVLPLKLKNASGSPVRAVASLYNQ